MKVLIQFISLSFVALVNLSSEFDEGLDEDTNKFHSFEEWKV